MKTFYIFRSVKVGQRDPSEPDGKLKFSSSSDKCELCDWRSSVLSIGNISKCVKCARSMCRQCAHGNVCSHCHVLSLLEPKICGWLLNHLTRKYRLKMSDSGGDAVKVIGRQRVSGLTGLVRYHCETVMASMVASVLDHVDTEVRWDLVSIAIYHK